MAERGLFLQCCQQNDRLTYVTCKQPHAYYEIIIYLDTVSATNFDRDSDSVAAWAKDVAYFAEEITYFLRWMVVFEKRRERDDDLFVNLVVHRVRVLNKRRSN